MKRGPRKPPRDLRRGIKLGPGMEWVNGKIVVSVHGNETDVTIGAIPLDLRELPPRRTIKVRVTP